MKTISFVPFFLFIFWQSHCQTAPQSEPLVASGWGTSIFGSGNHSNISSVPKSRDIKYEHIEGSPYIDNNSGANKNIPIDKFYTASNEYLETALARYNAYTDDMEVSLLNDGLDYYFLKKKPKSFYIMLGKITYRAYEFNTDV